MRTGLRRFIPALGILALAAAPMPALAQQPAAPTTNSQNHEGIGIGVKIGPLFSSLNEANVSNGFSNRTGVIGGLFLGGNRAGIVGVGVDLLYARKGAKEPNGSETLDLDYLEVPVYARINVGSSSRSRVSGYGIVGVDLNFLLKAQLSAGGLDVKDQFERADYGIAYGAGVEITRFVVEGRFTNGLGNIAKDKSEPVVKTRSFALMFGVRFN